MDREEVIERVIAALRRALSSKTSPEMVEAIIKDTREELLPRATSNTRESL